jgi:SNF2 family DNA or RNA helicase
MGISLAGAASVFFADLHVEPATLLQAEDRALVHGIGGLDVEYFVVADTVDEHVVSIVMPKMEQIEVAMGDEEAGAFRAAFTPEVVADEVWARMAAAAA